MRKILMLIMTTTIFLTACSQSTKINTLKVTRQELINQIDAYNTELEIIKKDLEQKQQELDLIVHKINGIQPTFIFTLELKQSHFTLDIGKMIKDAMNTVTFEIAVDEELYNQQKIGDKLLKEFRHGSFWTEGSIGNWIITVVDKRIEYN